MDEVSCRKAYVSVNVDIDEHGAIVPRFIRWEGGRIYRVEELVYKCRAASNKVLGGGIRYTVRIRGKETYLFDEGNNKWFVEAKETRACDACR